MAIQVLMIDDNVDYVNEVKQYFSSSEVFDIIDYKHEGSKIDVDYDVLLLNLLLSDDASFKILENNDFINKKIIISSEFVTSQMLSRLSAFNTDYFIKQPCSMNTLENILLKINAEKKISDSRDLTITITDMLHQLGVPSHIKGFSYMRDGIQMIYNDSSIASSITKTLYPSIAHNYDTTSSRVERAIRHAIEVSWVRGDYQLMENYFGNSVDYDRAKPTNSEFLATLADRLKIETS